MRVHLITWRIARRFGGRGLAVVAFVAAVLGPMRDYGYSNLLDPQDDICRRNRIKPPPFESGSSALTWESTASA